MKLSPKSGFVALSLLGFTACSHHSVVSDTQTHPSSAATIKELMLTQIDPHADGVWNAVSTTVTTAGTEEKEPRTDEEWADVRQHALALIEATKLLAEEGRPVATKGETSENPGIEESPEEIQKLISAKPKLFSLYAEQLRTRTEEALAAVDAKNPAALIEVGGRIDEACEQCHKTFWYPNQFKTKK